MSRSSLTLRQRNFPLYGATVPGYGSPPATPVMDLEELDPPHIDGMRRRERRLSFVPYTLSAIVPCDDLRDAANLREHLLRNQHELAYLSWGPTGANHSGVMIRSVDSAVVVAGSLVASGLPSPSPGGAHLSIVLSLIHTEENWIG